MDTIGQRLKAARKMRGMSQMTLADTIGVSRGVITNIERDIIQDPQPIVINAICDVLHINRKWLLDNSGPMETKNSNQNAQILSEIYSNAKELSEEELLFIRDVIRSYTKHHKE